MDGWMRTDAPVVEAALRDGQRVLGALEAQLHLPHDVPARETCQSQSILHPAGLLTEQGPDRRLPQQTQPLPPKKTTPNALGVLVAPVLLLLHLGPLRRVHGAHRGRPRALVPEGRAAVAGRDTPCVGSETRRRLGLCVREAFCANVNACHVPAALLVGGEDEPHLRPLGSRRLAHRCCRSRVREEVLVGGSNGGASCLKADLRFPVGVWGIGVALGDQISGQALGRRQRRRLRKQP